METLKRDWDSSLTLRDVLVTISCLLIQPNPDSALNAEAGALIQEDYGAFAKRAELMTSIQAGIPTGLMDAVKEAQSRGQESDVVVREDDVDTHRPTYPAAAPARRRQRPTTRPRGAARSSDGSPSGAPVRRRRHYTASNPFVVQTTNDDPFRSLTAEENPTAKDIDDDSNKTIDENQENDESRSPTKSYAPKVATPRRPLGAPVPLGELTLDETSSSDVEDGSEEEYPPSPRKSPAKSPMKQRLQPSTTSEDSGRPESSRAAVARARDITPAQNLVAQPLAHGSPFVDSSFMQASKPSPRKNKGGLFTPGVPRAPLFGSFGTPQRDAGIFKNRQSSSAEKRRAEQKRRAELEARLWDLCGRDVGRWNRGDFDGEPFVMKAKRW